MKKIRENKALDTKFGKVYEIEVEGGYLQVCPAIELTVDSRGKFYMSIDSLEEVTADDLSKKIGFHTAPSEITGKKWVVMCHDQKCGFGKSFATKGEALDYAQEKINEDITYSSAKESEKAIWGGVVEYNDHVLDI